MAGAEMRPFFFAVAESAFWGLRAGTREWEADFSGMEKIADLGIFFVCGGEKRKIFSAKRKSAFVVRLAV